MNIKIHTFLSRCLLLVCLLAAVMLFGFNILYTTTVSYDTLEQVTIVSHILPGIFMLLAIAVIIFVLKKFKSSILSIKETHLFGILSFVYGAAAVYLISNIDLVLRADPMEVSKAAQNLLDGDLSAFQPGEYLFRHPHQIGLMLYDALLYLVTTNVAINFIMNLLFILGINYLIYKTANFLFKDHFTNLLTIVFSFAFLPQLFFMLFAYGTIPGLFFLILAFYHTLKFCETRKSSSLVILLGAAAVAVFLRKNYMIGIIAIVLFLILDMIKHYSWKHLVLIPLLVLSIVLPSKVLSAHFLEAAGVPVTSGTPSVLWIVMGTDIDNTLRGPGWYDDSVSTIFQEAGYDAAVAGEIGAERLAENIQKIKREPVRAFRFFYNKTVSVWTDPLYQAVWSGPMESCQQFTHTKLLQSLFAGGKAETLLSVFCKMYTVLLWGMAVLYLLKSGKKGTSWQLMYMFLIGGLFFHLFWEAKSQYVHPYAFCLIPFAASALASVADGHCSLFYSKVRKK